MDVLANSSILIKFEETAALNNSCTQIDLNTLIYAEKPIVCRLCLSADSNNSNFITLLDAIGFETKIVDIVAKHLAFVQVFDFILNIVFIFYLIYVDYI